MNNWQVGFKKGDKVKFDNGGLTPTYGTVKRVNKKTLSILVEGEGVYLVNKGQVNFD